MATGNGYMIKTHQPILTRFKYSPVQQMAAVAMAGQTGGAVRVVLDFLFLLYQDKRKGKDKMFPRGFFLIICIFSNHLPQLQQSLFNILVSTKNNYRQTVYYETPMRHYSVPEYICLPSRTGNHIIVQEQYGLGQSA